MFPHHVHGTQSRMVLNVHVFAYVMALLFCLLKSVWGWAAWIPSKSIVIILVIIYFVDGRGQYEAHCSLPSKAEIYNVWTFTSTPSMPSWLHTQMQRQL